MSRREPERNDDGMGFWGGLAAAVAAGAAIGMGIAAAVAASKETNQKVASNSSFGTQLESGQRVQGKRRESKYTRLVLAVDATPKRGGAVLITSHNKTISFYSVDWTSHFNFPQESHHQTPDIFELTNAVLAMDFFSQEIQRYSEYYEDVIVKTDNYVMKTSRAFPNNKLRSRATVLIDEIGGTWEFCQNKMDTDIRLADKLSRNQLNEFWQIISDKYDDHKIMDGTDSITPRLLERIKQCVPDQFHRGPNNVYMHDGDDSDD